MTEIYPVDWRRAEPVDWRAVDHEWKYGPQPHKALDAQPDLRDFPTHKGTVYLCGPIVAQTYQEARYGWRKQAMEWLPPGIVCLSPMRQESYLAKTAGLIDDRNLPAHHFASQKVIFQKDCLDIKRSDIILVHLLGATAISKGSLGEVAIAWAWGKTIIVAMEEQGNPNDGIFLREPSLVLPTLEQACEVTAALLSEGL